MVGITLAVGASCVSAAAETPAAHSEAPFWQQLLIATLGPAAATLFGGLWAQLIVARVQNRRRRAEVAAHDRKREYDTKMQLIQEMSQAADGLYFALQLYSRRTIQAKQTPTDEAKAALRSELDGQYRISGVAGAALETRLKLLFASAEPWKYWHAARDILTVRYFQLIGLADDVLLAANARDKGDGEWHSGLTKEELATMEARALLDTYRERLTRAVQEVLKQPIKQPSS